MSPSALYSRVALLDRQRHRGQRVLPFSDFTPAARMNAVYCAAAEFAEACKCFPLLFIPGGGPDVGGAAGITPVCLLGLQNDENLFVDDGAWQAPYVPAYLRRYPFTLARGPASDASVPGSVGGSVAIDEDFAGLGMQLGGELLFGEDGEPTPHLGAVVRFLKDFDAAVELTRPVGAHLQSLGLLKEMRAQGPLPGGKQFSVDGFLVVDEDRLAALPDEAVLALHRSGLLALIHAHLVSLSNLHVLVERKKARA